MRIILFDRIKVVMKVFIVVTHVVLITEAVRGQWLFPLWIDQAVPFFWMISAYLFARSADRRGSRRAVDELRLGRLLPRLRRVAVPYTAVYLAILALMLKRAALVSSANSLVGWEVASGQGPLAGAIALAVTYACGGPGPGGYYIPCLVQMYLVLPSMWFCLKRRPAVAALLVVLVTGAFELLAVRGAVSPQAYRLAVVRYLPFLFAGLAFYRMAQRGALSLSNRPGLAAALVSLALGGAYVYGVSYLGFPALGVGEWSTTNTFSALYSGSAFYLMLAASASRVRERGALAEGSSVHPAFDRAVEQLSKAALHVYVFQMLWYYFINEHADAMQGMPLPLVIAFNVAACVGLGYALYALESRAKIGCTACARNYVGFPLKLVR